jgi:hypothetical protein
VHSAARIGVDRQMFSADLGPGDETNAVVEARST